jgi:hypothetical protein
MSFPYKTAEDVLAALPLNESGWEWKSADFLTPARKGDLTKEIGKQVSAFANSEGGYLAFGIAEDKAAGVKSLEECPTKMGAQSMFDFLSTVTAVSVYPATRGFKIHQLPIAADPTKFIFVVEISKSVAAAPHQARELVQYFWRTEGHSKPAPGHYLDLLWNQTSRAVITLSVTECALDGNMPHASPEISFRVGLRFVNESLELAEPFAVLIQVSPSQRWLIGHPGTNIGEGFVHMPVTRRLFPLMQVEDSLSLRYSVPKTFEISRETIHDIVRSCEFSFRPLSQNYCGDPVTLRPQLTVPDFLIDRLMAQRQNQERQG